ncbi:MAG: hypothetical protein EHM58_04460 [Ignavibacteriae bacterium]|nr:MAG: hypothetical protein EHM58_04460 [Ignavibacteriota bacterium]
MLLGKSDTIQLMQTPVQTAAIEELTVIKDPATGLPYGESNGVLDWIKEYWFIVAVAGAAYLIFKK